MFVCHALILTITVDLGMNLLITKDLRPFIVLIFGLIFENNCKAISLGGLGTSLYG